jgi:hypothetical protein
MEANTDLKATIGELVGAGAEQLEALKQDLRAGAPAKPLFGVLPLSRAIPQDVHSLLDYAGGVSLCVGALVSSSASGQAVGHALGGSTIGVSLLTDYRLSLKKVIPIEVHEALDYVVGLSAIAAPFAFGYWKKDRLASALHVAVGLTVLVGSLFTDYRSSAGKTWGRSER